MRKNVFVRRWKQNVRVWFQFLLPNRLLRYFPPLFVVRDPALSLLHKARKSGRACGVVVLHIEGFNKIMMMFPASTVLKLQKQMVTMITNLAPKTFDGGNIIAATQMQDDAYAIYIQSRSKELAFEEMTARSLAMQRELAKHIKQDVHSDISSQLQVQWGVHMIDSHIQDTALAAKAAYQYALAVATKKLPSNFSPARQELFRIIEQEDVSVLAQPIIQFQDGEIFGWEILTRGPQHSPFYYPNELFDFAYQADLLSKLEFLVFRKAFEKISEIGISEQVFINVTAVTLCHPLFDREILQLLEQFPQVKPERIVLELTERHLIRDFHHMASVMLKYRKLGFRFAVDDAGAGYSSLQSISELIPDIIKIDKSVIQNIDQTSVKESLLQALLTFAQHIDCKVIAEGVERMEEADVLYRNHVHMGQGFYFAKPSPLLFTFDHAELEMMRRQIRSLRQTLGSTSGA